MGTFLDSVQQAMEKVTGAFAGRSLRSSARVNVRSDNAPDQSHHILPCGGSTLRLTLPWAAAHPQPDRANDSCHP